MTIKQKRARRELMIGLAYLSDQMDALARQMIDGSRYRDELVEGQQEHGRELLGAAAIVKQWCKELRK